MAGRDLSAELFGDSAKTDGGRDFSSQLFAETEGKKKSTIGSELVRGGKQLASSVQTAAESLFGTPEEAALAGIERGRRISEEAGEGASLEAVKRAYEQDGLLSAAGEVVSQIPRALAGQGAQLASMAALGKAGAMAGTAVAPGPGTVIGGVLGAGAALLPQFLGSNVERQVQEQVESGQAPKVDLGKAGAAAAGQAAIESAGTAFVLGKRVVKGFLGIADDAALATNKARAEMVKAAERSLLAGAGRGAVRGTAEIPVEIAQQVIERYQAGLDVTSPDALSEYGEAAYQAALVGKSIGAVSGAADTAFARQARTESERILAEEEKRRAEAERAAEPLPPIQEPIAELGPVETMAPQEEPEYVGQRVTDTPRKRAEWATKLEGDEPLTGGLTDDLAYELRRRREADSAAAKVPLGEDYAFLQKEKQRLLSAEQTPEVKAELGRIDQQIQSVLTRDLADAERAKTSVFGQEQLPPVESRGAVVAERDLAEMQAREGTPELTDFELSRAKQTARMAGKPFVDETVQAERDAQLKQLRELKAERNKIKKGGNLYKMLEGQLDPSEVSDIAPDIKKLYGKGYRPLAKAEGQGSFISELVENKILDDFLPVDMRPESATFDVQKSTEYIKDKLRNKETGIEASSQEARELDAQISNLMDQMDGPARREAEILEAQEQRKAERVEALAAEATPEVEALRRDAEAAGIDVGPISEAAFEEAREQGVDFDIVLAERLSDAMGVERIRYKRAEGKRGIGKQAVQDAVDIVRARWANAPETVVAENMDDPVIPQEVRDHNKAAAAKGAKGSPQGFYYKGKAYVIADSIGSTNEAVETLMHEALGHFGLRGVFGPKMHAVLRDVIKNRRAEVEAKAEQYGLDPNNIIDMLEAAEEVLAVMAQTKPGLPFVKRAIAIIRNFLRDLGFDIKLSDNDIIQKYILPARAFVEKGPQGRARESRPARDESVRAMRGKDQTQTEAFKRWFGDSKVVDAKGDPLVVYHASTSPITVFKPKGYGTAGDHSYFYFAASEAWSKKFAQDELGVKPSMHKTYLSIKNPLDLRGKVMNGKGWINYLSNLGVNPTGALRQKLDAAPARLEISAWQLLRYDTPQNGAVREQLIDLGYDGLIMSDVVRGKMDNTTYVAFNPEQIKSATDNIGTFSPDTADIRYQREAEPATEPKVPVTRQNIFGEPVLGSWSIQADPNVEIQDGLIYKLLDKNIDVKRIVEAVKSTGRQVASALNPYLQEELYHGRVANAIKEFQDNEMVPLLKDMDRLGVTIGQLEQYLHNRHAVDYNKLVAKRNPDRPEMQDGGSGIKTADAEKYLNSLDAETKAKYEELAARIDRITKGTRKLLVDNGYEKAETIEGWEKAFPNYVPLMREEGDFDYNFGSFGTGRGFDVRRDFSRSAMGSKRNVVDIIGNVIAARNNAIMLTEKNRVAQAVYGLAVDAPNPDFWMAINPDAEKMPADAIDELRAIGLDEEAVNHLMKEPRQRVLDPRNDQIVSRINTKLRENDYVLATRINGEKRYVFFNPKDERSKRAATALKNLDAQDLGTTLGLIATATRWMASVNTQYNPIFGPYNFLRDVQSAALQLSTTPLAGQQKEVAANIIPSLRVIYSSLRKGRKGEKAQGELADLWKEFQKEGGQTGFRDNFSRTQDRTEALINELNRIQEGKVKAGVRAMFDWLSDYNDSLENAVRLSAYKVAKEKFAKEGLSDSEVKQKAASLAKNLTVNFNRKGDVATQMGALYAFFNASMQGTARMIETLKGPTGKKIMAGGLLLGSMQAMLMAAAGFDDEEPPEFIRSKNIVIPTWDGKYIAFPMPLGFHVIPGFSRILTEWAMSGFDDTARRVTDLTGLFLDAFNPIGNAGWSVQTITPTLLDPLVALGENKDWTGKPIAKEDIFSLRPTPGYTRAREGANFLTTEFAKFLNYASGGDADRKGIISPTPEQIEYLIGQAFGGVGREATKLTTSIKKTITGEELPPYKIPLYGRFVGETKSSAAESNKFYKNMKELNELRNVIDGRRERKEPLGDFMRENPEARLVPLANRTYNDIQKLRKRREALVERGAPREAVKQVEMQITRRMQILNERVAALKD